MAYQSHLSGHDMEASQSTGPGAFFPHAQHFIVAGGAFTSVINYFPAPSHIAPSEFADFRVIRLGDMDLRREIRLEQGSRMDAGHGPSSGLRRIHAVRLVGCASDMTAIVYQGRNAEKEWRREIHNYSGIRHPNIAQLFGIVSSDRLYATIFHDEWIPIQHFLTLFSDSVVATTYLKAHLGTELWEAEEYVRSISATQSDTPCYTLWIRRTTSRICIELVSSPTQSLVFPFISYVEHQPLVTMPMSRLSESMVITELGVAQYHTLVTGRWTTHLVPPHTTVRVGAITVIASGAHKLKEIALLRDVNIDIVDSGWCLDAYADIPSVVLENGWTRYDAAAVLDAACVYREIAYPGARNVWLAQATHVFTRYRVAASNYADYSPVDAIHYELNFACSTRRPPGYLFLCPLEDLQFGGRFRHPPCAAYWSLDPFQGKELPGCMFPSITLEVAAYLPVWDSAVYEGLRRFHSAKGFDPDSQDVAQHLGYPLYELAVDIDSEARTRSLIVKTTVKKHSAEMVSARPN